MSIVSCAALAAAVAAAVPGGTIALPQGSDCPGISISDRDFGSAGLTLLLDGATLRGLTLTRVSGVNVRGGTIKAPGGQSSDTDGRGAYVNGSSRITFEDVWFTDSTRGLVLADASNVRVSRSEFSGVRADGIIIVRSKHVRVEDNRMFDFNPVPTRCTWPDGTVTERISSRDCTGGGGVWKDGDHPDGVQMWDSVTDVQLYRNTLSGDMQGLARLGTAGSGIRRIYVEGNRLSLSRSHGITFTSCKSCRIIGNDVRSNGEGQYKTVIRYSKSTGRFCGNVAPDMKQSDPALQPC